MYKNCKYTKIISTWDYIDNHIINTLKNNDFIVLQNTFPDDMYKISVNYQNYSTMKGIEYAESINISHLLRIRADMSLNDINKMIDIYMNIYEKDKIIFFSHYHNNDFTIGYLIDYGHFGDIKDSKKYICNFQKQGDERFGEQFRQELCFGTSDLNIINKKVVYSVETLVDNNIEIIFLKEQYKNQVNALKVYLENYNKYKNRYIHQ